MDVLSGHQSEVTCMCWFQQTLITVRACARARDKGPFCLLNMGICCERDFARVATGWLYSALSNAADWKLTICSLWCRARWTKQYVSGAGLLRLRSLQMALSQSHDHDPTRASR